MAHIHTPYEAPMASDQTYKWKHAAFDHVAFAETSMNMAKWHSFCAENIPRIRKLRYKKSAAPFIAK